jgi:hypothetical protein
LSPSIIENSMTIRSCSKPMTVPRSSAISLSPYLRRAILAGGGSISAILLRQSASEAWGPETKVPLILVEYQPDTTPRRSDSSVPTFRGERFCMGCFHLCVRNGIGRG